MFFLGNSPSSEVYMPTFRNTLFHVHRQVGAEWISTPTCLCRWNRQSVPKRRHIKFRRRGITQKKTYNKPLTVCCQLATCFGTVGPLSRNFQQLLFSLYNYFKLLMMDEGGRNMQQADCRQFWVSQWIEVYWFLFVLRAAPILIAIFFLIPPKKHLHLNVRCHKWPDIGGCGLVPKTDMRLYQTGYGTLQWLHHTGL